jgi:DNA (cytosine-5)-methyltransferase 1
MYAKIRFVDICERENARLCRAAPNKGIRESMMPSKKGKSKIGAVDLFCGAGGLTHGLNAENIPVIAGIDIDENCRHPFETNNGGKFLNSDVGSFSNSALDELFGGTEVRVLAGCAPCQPFSTYSQRYETVGSPQWSLLYKFGQLAKGCRPEIVTMENVSSISRHSVFDDFIETLRTTGYHVFHETVDCTLYGLPQSRRRTVLLASLLGPIELIPSTHKKPRTVRHVLSRVPPIESGQTHSKDHLHTSATLSPLNLERIKVSKPGGTWRDWPEELISPCHRRKTGKTYPSVYGRMSWDEPSPTLTTQFFGFGNGRYGHPEQNRAISLREGAILQGFPASYSFIPKGRVALFKVLGRLIGNAVPVTLGRAIGQSINAHLGVNQSKSPSEENANREPNRDQSKALVA